MSSILRSMFRPSRGEIWKRLSERMGGEFIDREGSLHDELRVEVGPWTVTLDYHCEHGGRTEKLFTRLRAPYVNADGFRFSIYHEGVFQDIAKLFGLEDIQTGYEELDGMFVLQASDQEKLRAMCASRKLRTLILSEPKLHLRIRDSGDWFRQEFPEGVDELLLEIEGQVRDLDRLEKLYELFSETLHRLCHIGSAYEDDPDVDE